MEKRGHRGKAREGAVKEKRKMGKERERVSE